MTPALLTVTPAGTRIERWLALAWGLAESTVFFIVPDVLLTRIALRDLRHAWVAACWAVAGALLGGAALWFVATSGAAVELLRFFEKLPGINRFLSYAAASALHHDGISAFFTGAVTGVPYKLLATHAAVQGISLPGLLFVSALARSARFFVTTTVAWLAGRALHWLPLKAVLRLHSFCWFAFYLIYFMLVARGQ
jgi:membrane protein YqaA with SNARE-associated domain